jgi:hypothetical protein
MPSPPKVYSSAVATALVICSACFGGSAAAVHRDAGVESFFDASMPPSDTSVPPSETRPFRDATASSNDAPPNGVDAEAGATGPVTAGTVQTIAGGPFQPYVSGDGRYVAFTSSSATLVAGDTNGATDTFVWDTCVGSTAPTGCTPSTTRVSIANDGSELSQGVYGDGSSISADGRFVVFDTPSPGGQIYVRDTCAGQTSGCTPSTTLVSADVSGRPGNGTSERPALSTNGRVVAFDSTSTNLTGDAAGVSILVRDTCVGALAGCVPSIVSVPVAQGTSEPYLSLSGDGRYLAYEGYSMTSDGGLAPGQVNMYDTCIGAAAGCSPSTTLLSVGADSLVAGALVQSPGVDRDGRIVAFQSAATNLVSPPASGKAPDVYVRDTCLGPTAPMGCVPKTTLLFDNETGCMYCAPINYEGTQYLSATGRLVALMTAPGSAAHSVSVFDTCFGAPAGCSPSSVVVTVDSAGQPIPVTYFGLSGDGRYLAFSDAQKGYLARTGL